MKLYPRNIVSGWSLEDLIKNAFSGKTKRDEELEKQYCDMDEMIELVRALEATLALAAKDDVEGGK